jgi:glycerol uptake facilitator-like aquaporin
MHVVGRVVLSVVMGGLAGLAALVATFPTQGDDSYPPSCASLLNRAVSCSESDSWQVAIVTATATFVLVMLIAMLAGHRGRNAASLT